MQLINITVTIDALIAFAIIAAIIQCTSLTNPFAVTICHIILPLHANHCRNCTYNQAATISAAINH